MIRYVVAKNSVVNMVLINLVILSVLFVASEGVFQKFPPNFKFGASTSAYQIEGAWNVSGKSVNIWDDYTHSARNVVADKSNGDVACDSFNQWRRDVQIAKELGLNFYRFSISWSRLLPQGLANEVSVDGKKYYSDLVDALLSNGIEPVITLYHMDLPLRLQHFGGWANPLISEWFAAYARVAFSLYADRVKTWITINDPMITCDLGYDGLIAPAIRSPTIGSYLCSKNILLAHAKAWRLYDREFRPKYHGQISIANQVIWFEEDKKGDSGLADLLMQNSVGRFSHPIYTREGGWPPSLEKVIAENSKKEGHTKSRLPAFTREEIELIRGTFDFYGVNHYTSRVVRRAVPGEEVGSWPLWGCRELQAVLDSRSDWTTTSIPWIKLYPNGFRNSLVWLKEHYGDISYLVTENGFPDNGYNLNDRMRTNFFKDYLRQLYLAIRIDKVDVTGYAAWSLMDSFEWTQGYKSKFGLYEVDFSNPQRPRTARSSALYYSSVIKNNALGTPENHSSYTIVWVIMAVLLITVVLCAMLLKYFNDVKGYEGRRQYESVGLSDISLFPARS
ncbi:unnamed protein product [Diatraea saccharalis]|uniref:Myrosinase 1-like n=1 Tax=Diatraea saccharalis TaxID=40085 RepID=A0A9N9R997_9NEOP|nr:unnamed protein product [Diatraea saccharalis]